MRDLAHIVVFAPAGVDPSGAIGRARTLLATGGRLTVVDVLPELPALARAVLPPSLDTIHVRERERELNDVVRRNSVAADALSVQVMVGNPASRLARFVVDEHVGLVFKVSAGATADAPLDALDMKLLRKCPCAVWIVAPGAMRPLRTVLAAVDAFAANEDEGLAQSIVRHALSAATQFGADVHVVHAWQVFGERLLSRHVSAAEIEAMVHDTQRIARDALHRVLRQVQHPIAEAHVHLVRGEPAPGIARAAEQVSADLVVIGTVARTGLPGLVMGNTAESVLPLVTCEVLAVKPAGFVSPLLAAPTSSSAAVPV